MANRFYRRMEAFCWDINLLLANAEAYNESESALVTNARVITKSLLRVARGEEERVALWPVCAGSPCSHGFFVCDNRLLDTSLGPNLLAAFPELTEEGAATDQVTVPRETTASCSEPSPHADESTRIPTALQTAPARRRDLKRSQPSEVCVCVCVCVWVCVCVCVCVCVGGGVGGWVGGCGCVWVGGAW